AAHVCSSPAETCLTLVSTNRGSSAPGLEVMLSPTWPRFSMPQQKRSPLPSSAQACSPPVLIWMTFFTSATARGVALSDLPPSPSCPESPAPQQLTVLSAKIAHEKPPVSPLPGFDQPPAAIAVAFCGSFTLMGVVEGDLSAAKG